MKIPESKFVAADDDAVSSKKYDSSRKGAASFISILISSLYSSAIELKGVQYVSLLINHYYVTNSFNYMLYLLYKKNRFLVCALSFMVGKVGNGPRIRRVDNTPIKDYSTCWLLSTFYVISCIIKYCLIYHACIIVFSSRYTCV